MNVSVLDWVMRVLSCANINNRNLRSIPQIIIHESHFTSSNLKMGFKPKYALQMLNISLFVCQHNYFQITEF